MRGPSIGLRAFAERARVWTHVHDNATAWRNNSADARAVDLATWFRRTLVETHLAEALVLTPYTNPEKWDRYKAEDEAMKMTLFHARHTATISADAGFPVVGGVEAQIVPIKPGDVSSLEFALDVPAKIARQLGYVIASVHAQPAETEKLPGHVQASRLAALHAPGVHTIGHIDRNVQHLAFPHRAFFQHMRAAGVALELNENYLWRYGFLKEGVPIRPSWNSFIEGDAPLAWDVFKALPGNYGITFAEYMDYRYTHLVRLAIEVGVQLIPALDWHLWHDPGDVVPEGGLGQEATNRLKRFGNWLLLREVPVELCPTRSLAAFRQFTAAQA